MFIYLALGTQGGKETSEEMTVLADKGDKGFAVDWPRKVQYFLLSPVNRGVYPKQGGVYNN